jgi:hypothetical protein
MTPQTPEEKLMNIRSRPTNEFMVDIEPYLPPECIKPVTNINGLSWDLRERAILLHGVEGWCQAATYYMARGKSGIESSGLYGLSWLACRAKPQDWIIIALLLEMWRPKYDS